MATKVKYIACTVQLSLVVCISAQSDTLDDLLAEVSEISRFLCETVIS